MTDVNNYLIYLYRNIVNGKLYVGQTHDIYKRCSESGYKGSTYFYHAIQKYGFEKFEQIVLKENLSSEEVDYWEKFYIKFFNTTNHQFGYNITDGGNKCVLCGEQNGFYGKHHSTDAIRRMKQKKIGGNNPLAKPVLCITTGEKFPSCREASDWCGASRQHINRVCRGERKHTGKHPITGELLEWRYIDDIG